MIPPRHGEKAPQAPPAGVAPRYAVLDLFSGIGGFSLGLERAGGFKAVAFCEIDRFCRRVLRKHWPDVPIYEDVRTLHAKDIPGPVDVVCGGYPCQPFSLAGKRRGQEDDRHLWPEALRLVRELSATGNRPAWCIFENVAGHVSMGLDEVLSDLEGEGYACWPLVIPACALNAPHRRDRVWIIAHSGSTGREKQHIPAEPGDPGHVAGRGDAAVHADATSTGLQKRRPGTEQTGEAKSKKMVEQKPERFGNTRIVANPEGKQAGGVFKPWFSPDPEPGGDWRGKAGEWTTEPPVCGPDDGIPDRVARLKALGNAVVPQIPELIGRAILSIQGKHGASTRP